MFYQHFHCSSALLGWHDHPSRRDFGWRAFWRQLLAGWCLPLISPPVWRWKSTRGKSMAYHHTSTRRGTGYIAAHVALFSVLSVLLRPGHHLTTQSNHLLLYPFSPFHVPFKSSLPFHYMLLLDFGNFVSHIYCTYRWHFSTLTTVYGVPIVSRKHWVHFTPIWQHQYRQFPWKSIFGSITFADFHLLGVALCAPEFPMDLYDLSPRARHPWQPSCFIIPNRLNPLSYVSFCWLVN